MYDSALAAANPSSFLISSAEYILLKVAGYPLEVIAQSVMVRYVSQDWVSSVVGMQNSYSVLIATIVGIPAYISSISAVPLLRGLMDLGMDKGAVLAFIIAGPIMSIPSIVAVMALFKRRALYIYVAVGFFGALIFGYTYRLL